ncbi:MAG: hypothetical protein ACRDZ1_04405 [Acidimicrobiia bacterium]
MMRERFSLPVDLLDELRRRAHAEGVTLSELAGRLIAEHLPNLLAELLAERLHADPDETARSALTRGPAP